MVNRLADRVVGVLALQGDYERHQVQLDLLGVKNVQVRLPEDLVRVDSLIFPGGETTTMSIMLDRHGLREPLKRFGRVRPVYGTCAGMIMLAQKIEDNRSEVEPLGLADIDVVRNGYGRQVFSFEAQVTVDPDVSWRVLTATFIRAPRITRVGPEVRVLAEYEHHPVLIQQNNVLAASFHTELDEDTTLLEYFLTHIHSRAVGKQSAIRKA